MVNNLKLITTETFGDLSCNFYRNMNDDILLTREQIGTALEYTDPDNALYKIHKRHQDRLDNLSVVSKLSSTDNKSYETILYTQRGIMEICRWSNKPKANLFMDWVWDIVEKYRNNELLVHNQETLDNKLATAIDNMSTTLSSINDRLTKLEEQQNKKKFPEKKYSRWKTNTFNKLNTLLSYVNEHSDENLKLSEIIHLVIGETEDIYTIEMNDYMDAYKSEFDLETNPYVIDVINHYKDIRDMFTLTLDSIMEKLHIGENTSKQKKNIFDELAAMVESENKIKI